MGSLRENLAVKYLASLKLTVYCLIILSVLVVWGTFFQVENGLHAAQERFFESWVVLGRGFIPFPGTKTVIAVLALNLTAAFFRRFPFRLKNTGMILMHLGTALLFIGGALSTYLVKESMISLSEGERTSSAIGYGKWELSVLVKSSERDRNIIHESRSISDFRAGRSTKFQEAGITFKTHAVHQNSVAYGRKKNSIDSIAPAPLSEESGMNIPGMVASVAGDGTASAARRLFIYGGAGEALSFMRGTDSVYLSLHPKMHSLPLQIELLQFTKQTHPGTTTAKSYQSRIRAKDGKEDREALISMNRPFRYGSFTFYQTGYKHEDGRNYSSLAVVENPVRHLPYISCIIIMIGMMLHFALQFRVALMKSKRGGK